jgi:hypothetical protein
MNPCLSDMSIVLTKICRLDSQWTAKFKSPERAMMLIRGGYCTLYSVARRSRRSSGSAPTKTTYFFQTTNNCIVCSLLLLLSCCLHSHCQSSDLRVLQLVA